MELPEHLAGRRVGQGIASGAIYISGPAGRQFNDVVVAKGKIDLWWDKFTDEEQAAIVMASVMRTNHAIRIGNNTDLQESGTIIVRRDLRQSRKQKVNNANAREKSKR